VHQTPDFALNSGPLRPSIVFESAGTFFGFAGIGLAQIQPDTKPPMGFPHYQASASTGRKLPRSQLQAGRKSAQSPNGAVRDRITQLRG